MKKEVLKRKGKWPPYKHPSCWPPRRHSGKEELSACIRPMAGRRYITARTLRDCCAAPPQSTACSVSLAKKERRVPCRKVRKRPLSDEEQGRVGDQNERRGPKMKARRSATPDREQIKRAGSCVHPAHARAGFSINEGGSTSNNGGFWRSSSSVAATQFGRGGGS